MSDIKATITGTVKADPTERQVGSRTVYDFPVYVKHTRKKRDSNTYEPTGDVSKIRVTVWGDNPGVGYGDLVEVEANLVEREFTKRDGTPGRSLQTDWVKSVRVIRRSTFEKQAAPVEYAPALPGVESAPF